MRLRRAPLAVVLSAATLLGCGAAWVNSGAPEATMSRPTRVDPGPASTAERATPRATFALDNTDYGPPPGVTDPPAGHVRRLASGR